MVRIMLRRDGIDVNQAFGGGFIPLCAASGKGHEQVVRALVDLRAEVNQANEDGSTRCILRAVKATSRWCRRSSISRQR